MEVDLTIRHPDDRLCEVVVCRPGEEMPLDRIATSRAELGESITAAMLEAGGLYEVDPLGRSATME